MDDGQLNISLLTPFLKAQSKQFSHDYISRIELNVPWLIDCPAAVHIKHKDNWVKYEILDKKLITEIRKEVDAADERLAARLK